MKPNTEPSIGASHQASVHLVKQLQRKRCLEIDQSETRMACGGHAYQRRRSKCAFVWHVLYKDCSFRLDPFTNMATTGNSCFWMVDF
jgi:hypothetical protein